MTFAVATGGGNAVGLSDAQFETIVSDSFEAWANVDCGDGTRPGFVAQSTGIVQASEPLFCAAQPDANVNVFFFVSNWEYSYGTLGFTHTSYGPSSGAILDADVELNADYVLDASPSNREPLLLAVIKHEVGHFLGLGHSNDMNAVMAVTYDPSSALIPDFTQDDIDGICAAFPPSQAPTECPALRVDEAGLSSQRCNADSLENARAQSATSCALVTAHKASSVTRATRENPSSFAALRFLSLPFVSLMLAGLTLLYRRKRPAR